MQFFTYLMGSFAFAAILSVMLYPIIRKLTTRSGTKRLSVVCGFMSTAVLSIGFHHIYPDVHLSPIIVFCCAFFSFLVWGTLEVDAKDYKLTNGSKVPMLHWEWLRKSKWYVAVRVGLDILGMVALFLLWAVSLVPLSQ